MDALAQEGPLDTRQLALSVIRAKGLSTDANGNYTANLVGAVPGSNSVFVSVESLFQQALNGDGKMVHARRCLERLWKSVRFS